MAQVGDAAAGGAEMNGDEKLEQPDFSSANWYFPREHIEKSSPSRKDGIDLKKETYLRKSYCTFLQDLGMRLKVPQVTIATSIVFCHRFFLRQSHAKNDRYLIATSCMFLAGKVEETPQKLCDVIFLSYEIQNKKDPTAIQRIKQKDLYEPQKELVLLGERSVLTTLGFDLNIHHPYKPLVAAIKKFKVAQNALAQVAWNFVNDGLRTSLCLQFKPHHIAAGAIFLAAKFLKVKLPSEGEKIWWQEFEVTPRQLEEVSNQMLELYEQNREAPASRASDPGASGHHNKSAGVSKSSSAQVSEKNPWADAKCREHATNICNVDEAVPSVTDRRPVSNSNELVDQRSRISTGTNMDSGLKASAILDSESSLQESQKLTDLSCISKPSAQVSLPVAQLVENSHVKAETDCRRLSSVVSLHVTQSVKENTDWEPKENVSASRAADKTKGASTHASGGLRLASVGEEQDQNSASPQRSRPKSEWVDLADVNIDRVKAAIQRRKKGDQKPSLARRELTDEEELLELDLENGQHESHQSGGEMSAGNVDSEADELLERKLEGAEGGHHRSSQPQHHDDDRPNASNDIRRRFDCEKQGRDYKRPRLDSGR